MTRHNIIIFGESGAGKSSVLNMLAGEKIADISSGALGCTLKSQGYDLPIHNTLFRVHDTAGLDEGEKGRVPKADAIVQLYKLLMELEDGVSLLVFCMKAPRIKESARDNWRLFYEVICKRNVPIVIVITGLEQEEVMDNWWTRPENKGAFQQYGMAYTGYACVTAIKGKRLSGNRGFQLQEEYDASKAKIEKLIVNSHLTKPWRVERMQWFRQVCETTYESQWCGRVKEHKTWSEVREGVQLLIDRCGMSREDADSLGRKLEKIS